jgi:nucleoside-diphosphate-sugar epimerase
MTTLVAGASGATGRQLVVQLLDRGESVKAIVRSPNRLPAALRNRDHLSVIHASILDLDDAELIRHVAGCNAVASCLGHTLSLKGIFGRPRRLVTEATRRLCSAIQASRPDRPVRFVLMNTAGNQNRDLNEPLLLGEWWILAMVRLLLPPQADNEQAAEYLRSHVGQHDSAIEWTVVRPDTLTSEDHVTPYEVHPSPIRSAIFDAGSVSRINVGHFMADLITRDDLWNRWKGQMPVIYNRPSV